MFPSRGPGKDELCMALSLYRIRSAHDSVERALFLLLASCFLLGAGGLQLLHGAQGGKLELAGVTVTPHEIATALRYRRDPDPELGARVQLFLKNSTDRELSIPASLPVKFRGQAAADLLASGVWTWHDTPSAWPGTTLSLPPGALTVWTFNSRGSPWGVGTEASVEVAWPDGSAAARATVSIERPPVWISAVTFLGDGTDPVPRSLIFHVANRSSAPVRITGCKLWVPESNSTWRALRPGPDLALEHFPADGVIAPGDRGGARAAASGLPLSYVAVQVRLKAANGEESSLWAHLRVKREQFDLSGGWVASGLGQSNTLHCVPYLKTLRRMHINTGQIQEVAGYTDNPALYDLCPLKYMNRFEPFERYDNDATLPRIHAVEFLGEPQYGGGRPVPPMEVWQALAPYQRTRLPTSVTHSEERIWRYYAGLSDYPHYDAYRVCAPAADAWSRYDRWGGRKISWGAPLETIGDLTRSLRELNRPAPIAYWSQGAHEGWDRMGGRQRTSPTQDELRSQAYHALAARITSLYWFNLSLKSLVKFPDLIEPITRVNREIRMLERFYLEGDAYHHQAIQQGGRPDWELSVIASPSGAVLFALDLDYQPDPEKKTFVFGPPRASRFVFPLPAYLRSPAEVLRVDADGVTTVDFRSTAQGVEISDRLACEGIYVVSRERGLGTQLEAKRQRLLAVETSMQFDPAGNSADLEQLRALLGRSPVR
jgi:hypothetical protein